MFSIIVILISICIVLFLFFEKKDSCVQNGDMIVFEFDKGFKKVMSICVNVCAIISLMFSVISLTVGGSNELGISILCLVLAFPCLWIYLLARNKKIIYKDNKLYVYDILCRKKQFDVKEIKEAIENPEDGIKLIFNDNKKVKVDIQMINYSKIKEILDMNGIVCKDKNGNDVLKGW